jgi:hypothetical protein
MIAEKGCHKLAIFSMTAAKRNLCISGKSLVLQP